MSFRRTNAMKYCQVSERKQINFCNGSAILFGFNKERNKSKTICYLYTHVSKYACSDFRALDSVVFYYIVRVLLLTYHVINNF